MHYAQGLFVLLRMLPLILLLAVVAYKTRPAAAESPGVEVEVAVGSEGKPTDRWMAALRRRLDDESWRKVRASARPLQPEETEWLTLIEEVAEDWARDLEWLNAPFEGVTPPAPIRILAGNQGANDGFTYERDTICSDLSDLVRAYGRAGEPRNRDRVVRILSHEYTHLLTKAWLDEHPWDHETPYLSAIWELYYEGIGNLRSLILSERWITRDHTLSPRAEATVAELEPVMVERLAGLSKNPDYDEWRRLHANLSAGPFTEKWGVLPIALWLAVDTRYESDRIAQWVKAGPAGILQLAVKYAAPENKPAFQHLLEEVQAQIAEANAAPEQ